MSNNLIVEDAMIKLKETWDPLEHLRDLYREHLPDKHHQLAAKLFDDISVYIFRANVQLTNLRYYRDLEGNLRPYHRDANQNEPNLARKPEPASEPATSKN
jgi:hypothetical protein